MPVRINSGDDKDRFQLEHYLLWISVFTTTLAVTTTTKQLGNTRNQLILEHPVQRNLFGATLSIQRESGRDTENSRNTTMWGASFNDLAKKAAEMQEQAAASIVRNIYGHVRCVGFDLDTCCRKSWFAFRFSLGFLIHCISLNPIFSFVFGAWCLVLIICFLF